MSFLINNVELWGAMKMLSLEPDESMKWIYDKSHPDYYSDRAKDLRNRRENAIRNAPMWMIEETNTTKPNDNTELRCANWLTTCSRACAKWLGRSSETCTRKPDGCLCEKDEQMWQTMETAPHDKRVMVWSGQEMYCAHWAQNPMTGDEAWIVAEWGTEGDQALVRPTHWRPLPLPPND